MSPNLYFFSNTKKGAKTQIFQTFFQRNIETMACSKLFSGDLPEISTYIIQNLRNNINTLYSLSLVNRFWCRLAIPLLWEDPFSIRYQENLTSHFLDTYFLFLNNNDKSKVNKIKPINLIQENVKLNFFDI